MKEPNTNPFAALFRSRKFWLLIWALIQTVAGYYFKLPTEIIVILDSLVGLLIAAIAYEDAAEKAQPMTIIESAPLDDDEIG